MEEGQKEEKEDEGRRDGVGRHNPRWEREKVGSSSSCLLGSFVVVDAESLEQLAAYHHRKEEISDVKFSPSESIARYTLVHNSLLGSAGVLKDAVLFT